MAKKTDRITKPAVAAAPVVPTPVPVPVAIPAAPAKRAIKPAAAKTKPAPKAAKTPAAKPKRSSKTVAPVAKATAPKKSHYTREDVALRAYFISEKRRVHGHHGDEHQDWIEAERQLLAEGTKRKKAKKA